MRLVTKGIGLLCLLGSGLGLRAQTPLPYSTYFDTPQDTIGWRHYALQGVDDWQWGEPIGQKLNEPLSSPNAWGTNLGGGFVDGSVMCLESPSFDLSGTAEYILSFTHKYHFTTWSSGGLIEYSTDGGTTWLQLNEVLQGQINWHVGGDISSFGMPGWKGSGYIGPFKFPSHGLGFLTGQSDVRFRFKVGGSYNGASGEYEGWVVDNFSIAENNPNVVAFNGLDIETIKFDTAIDVITSLQYMGINTASYDNSTEYYFSYDSIFNPQSDPLLGTWQSTVNGTVIDHSELLPMVPNLAYGQYFIFFKHDSENNLSETNESDNVAYCKLYMDSVFETPMHEDFEGDILWWKPSGVSSDPVWQLGTPTLSQILGNLSGTKSYWNPEFESYLNPSRALRSPYVDHTGQYGQVMCYWHQTKLQYPAEPAMHVYKSRSYDAFGYNADIVGDTVVYTRFDGWDCRCHDLLHTENYERAKYSLNAYNANNLDDIYIGDPLPDLRIPHLEPREISSSVTTDTVYYRFFNGGLGIAPSTSTEFYWSSDSLLDGTDQFLGVKLEPSLSDTSFVNSSFGFTVPNNQNGIHYIIAKVDANNEVNEMWENNHNLAVMETRLSPTYIAPYYNDFETDIDNWHHRKLYGGDTWNWGVPTPGNVVQQAFSGQKALLTNLNGATPMDQLSTFTTPIFDLTALQNPVLEFDMINDRCYETTSSITKELGLNLSYSLDNGATWKVLETLSDNHSNTIWNTGYSNQVMFLHSERSLAWYNNNLYGPDVDRVTHQNIDISHLSGNGHVFLRFNLGVKDIVGCEGAIIDNFSISEGHADLLVNYKKHLMMSSNSEEIRFWMNIKNKGNLSSEEGIVNFYTSNDSVLSPDDFFLGYDSLPNVQPDYKYYLNVAYDAPSNLAQYEYLLYEIDATGTTIESNEANNIGHWKLSLDSISTYPYLQDFNDTIVDGWHSYMETYWTIDKTYRWKNLLNVNEWDYGMWNYESGLMCSERHKYWNYPISDLQIPDFYLTSPVFDFSTIADIRLEFNIHCTGTDYSFSDPEDRQGGTLEYAINGGNNWTPLTDNLEESQNWFTLEDIGSLDYAPGWGSMGADGVLDTAKINISYLAGAQDVVFRFRFKAHPYNTGLGLSQHYNGMYIDNFKIETLQLDYSVLSAITDITVDISNPTIQLEYSFSNDGQADGLNTTTNFKWSQDSIFHNGDPPLTQVSESPLAAGETFTGIIPITYPVPDITDTYYILYKVDFEQILVETNEINNVGGYRVTFTDTNNLSGIDEQRISGINVSLNEESLVVTNLGKNDIKNAILVVSDLTGKTLYRKKANLSIGTNYYPLPIDISSGAYLVQLQSNHGSYTRKFIRTR